MAPGEPEPSSFDDERVLGAAAYSGVLSGAWKLYRASLAGLLKLFLAGILFIFLLEVGWRAFADVVSLPVIALVAGAITFSTLVPAIAGSVLFAAAHILMTDRFLGRATGVARAATELRRDIPSVLQGALIAATGAMFFGILPGLISLSFVWWGPPILATTIVLEGRPFPDAWATTRARLRGNLGRVALVVLAVALALVTVNFVVLAPVAIALRGLGTTGEVITYAAVALVTALLRPFAAAATLRLYFDVRARSDEGFTRQVLALERERVLSREA